MRVPGGLAPDDSLFLFQGVYSNQRSQSVLVDWFAVPFQGTRPQPIVAREEAIRRSGLVGVQGNPGTESVPAVLTSLREAAVEAARAHMQALRARRAEDISAPLREGMRALAGWRDKSLKLIYDRRLVASKGGAAPPTQVRRRLEAEEREIKSIYDERQRWITQGMRTVDEPYLRLAAVFVRADLA